MYKRQIEGDGTTCLALAEAVADGNGEQRDRYFRAACDSSEPSGCYLAGVSIMNTEPKRAAELFERGCSSDPPEQSSCGMIAWFQYQSTSDAEIRATAVKKLSGSCDAGFAEACFRLSKIDASSSSALIDRACALDEKRCDYFRAADQVDEKSSN